MLPPREVFIWWPKYQPSYAILSILHQNIRISLLSFFFFFFFFGVVQKTRQKQEACFTPITKLSKNKIWYFFFLMCVCVCVCVCVCEMMLRLFICYYSLFWRLYPLIILFLVLAFSFNERTWLTISRVIFPVLWLNAIIWSNNFQNFSKG